MRRVAGCQLALDSVAVRPVAAGIVPEVHRSLDEAVRPAAEPRLDRMAGFVLALPRDACPVARPVVGCSRVAILVGATEIFGRLTAEDREHWMDVRRARLAQQLRAAARLVRLVAAARRPELPGALAVRRASRPSKALLKSVRQMLLARPVLSQQAAQPDVFLLAMELPVAVPQAALLPDAAQRARPQNSSKK
jgi:hypothetical protein